MSTKHDILKLADDIRSISCNNLVFHKNRFKSLLQRVTVVVDLIRESLGDSQLDVTSTQALTVLLITLEEILEYLTIFSKKDRQLAAHIIKYGSDEEQFIKWTERLQHCIIELHLGSKVSDVFDDMVDIQNFQKDLVHLQSEILNVAVLFHGKDNKQMVQSLELLLGHQSKVRSSYKTKTAPDSELIIQPKKIKYDKVIGHGGFGVVWSARYKGEPVAIKTIPIQALTKKSIDALNAEANIMRRLAHPRIVSCFGVFENEGNHCIIMELMEFGSLHDYISDNPLPADWLLRYNIMGDICNGMIYLHRLNVIHRDLKPGNIVLDSHMRAKITDFGISVIKNTAVTSVKGQEMGTVQYMAPECFGLAPLFSTKSDVFAFSVITWELAHWKFPYEGVSFHEIRDSIRDNHRLAIDTAVPTTVSEMITACWDSNPKERPQFTTLAKIIDNEITSLNIAFPGKLELMTLQNADTVVRSTVAPTITSTKGANELPSTPQTKTKPNRKWIVIGTLAVLVLSGIITAIVLLTSSKKASGEILNTTTFTASAMSTATPLIRRPNTGNVSTYAAGITDPRSVAVNSRGILYLSTGFLNVIYTIDKSGTVTIIAGNSSGTAGFTNGKGLSASFRDPAGVAIASDDSVYVVEGGNNGVRKIDTSVIVTTIAGLGYDGFVDGPNNLALFANPRRISVGPNGNIFVADYGNNAVRKIDNSGYVTTVAGNGSMGFKNGPGLTATFNRPHGIAFDNQGQLFVSDADNNCIRKINESGYVTTYAGNGSPGLADGQGTDASFWGPKGLIYDSILEVLYVADSYNNVIRVINSTGYVSLFAGSPAGNSGTTDGKGVNATFSEPDFGDSLDSDGSFYVCDRGAGLIRKIS